MVRLTDIDEPQRSHLANIPCPSFDSEPWVCPIGFPPPPVDAAAGGGFKAAMEAEIGNLATWYDMARRERGCTTMGLSRMPIAEIAEFICAFLDGEMPANPNDEITLA